MKIHFNYEASYDLNNDGLVNENDITMLISIIFEQNYNQLLGDINLDSKLISLIYFIYLIICMINKKVTKFFKLLPS